MKLTVHRGTREVGGTCIELVANTTRIVLDIGLPLFGTTREPLDSHRLRRMSREELDDQGFLPNVPGLFDNGPRPDAILLSHAHMDHTGLLDRSNPDIPVYASRGTSKMMLAGKLFAGQVELLKDRFREITPIKPVMIGDLKITAFPVDHSIFGCLAFFIESEGKSVLYSGDLRLHGRKPGMMQTMAEHLRDKTIDALLMEGTHFGLSDGPLVNEFDLEDSIVEQVNEADGLVLASFSPQHVDRLVAFLRASIKTNRQFVADPYTAFVLHLIKSEAAVPVPGNSQLIRTFIPASMRESAVRMSLTKLLERFHSSDVQMEEIKANPKRFLQVFRPSMVTADFAGELPDNVLVLYSRWSGYLKQPEWCKAKLLISKANGRLAELHTSGHIFSGDIERFIQELRPNSIVPIHTFEPERFKTISADIKMLKDGQALKI